MASTVALLAGSTVAATAEQSPPKAGFVDTEDVVAVGWDGPLTVAWLNYDESQTFRVRVTGSGGYAYSEDIVIEEGSSIRQPVDLDPVTVAGDYTASFLDQDGEEVFDHDFRAALPVGLTVGVSTPRTFLPRVRDGIKDATRLSFGVERAAHVVGRVVDGRGRVVQVADLGLREPGVEHRWTWTGRSNDGAVDRGRYTLRLSASADGLEVSRDGEARVASYRVPVTRKVSRRGIQTVRRSPGDCRLTATTGRALRIDCRRAQRAAAVTWRFNAGRSAEDVRWAVQRNGAATLTRRRTGNALLITARVAPGAMFTADRVLSSYRSSQQR